ncbi:hypothetical protein [Streptomyces sp. NPDC001652]|uniref:hypothetical protein n=1 Tax=Streptomyces sp. NPDC001652 TaxID=3154393 RepID=UPI0033334720
MADFTSETVTRTIRRWIIPAAEPWGATAVEVDKAWKAAQAAYREQLHVPVGELIPDDALRFHVRDEAVVIEFAIEEQTT